MNGLVFLARGLGHHLDARVQNFFTRHDQACIATAKQLGEHPAKVFVDGFEGAAQQIAGFGVDFLDGIFQGDHGFVEVGRLGVQKALAFTRTAELFQGGQVDRTQGLNFAVETVDVGLHAVDAHLVLGH